MCASQCRLLRRCALRILCRASPPLAVRRRAALRCVHCLRLPFCCCCDACLPMVLEGCVGVDRWARSAPPEIFEREWDDPDACIGAQRRSMHRTARCRPIQHHQQLRTSERNDATDDRSSYGVETDAKRNAAAEEQHRPSGTALITTRTRSCSRRRRQSKSMQRRRRQGTRSCCRPTRRRMVVAAVVAAAVRAAK